MKIEPRASNEWRDRQRAESTQFFVSGHTQARLFNSARLVRAGLLALVKAGSMGSLGARTVRKLTPKSRRTIAQPGLYASLALGSVVMADSQQLSGLNERIQ